MMRHPGYVETKHAPRESVEWFRDRTNGNYSEEFCENLKEGDFIPCGNSGNLVYRFINGELDVWEEKPGFATCCFCFGKMCDQERFQRRWTCCGETRVCTLQEMNNIDGCHKTINLKTTK